MGMTQKQSAERSVEALREQYLTNSIEPLDQEQIQQVQAALDSGELSIPQRQNESDGISDELRAMAERMLDLLRNSEIDYIYVESFEGVYYSYNGEGDATHHAKDINFGSEAELVAVTEQVLLPLGAERKKRATIWDLFDRSGAQDRRFEGDIRIPAEPEPIHAELQVFWATHYRKDTHVHISKYYGEGESNA